MKQAVQWLGRVILIVWILGWPVAQWAGAEELRTIQQCSRIKNPQQRLACYDRLAQRETEDVAANHVFLNPTEPASSVVTTQEKTRNDETSRLTRLWDFAESSSRGRFVFMAHRDNYILPITYNLSPNRKPEHTGEVDTVDEAEAAFQLSIKVKLWQDVFGQDLDLWFGYTQRSFWQVYATDQSSPFRETNYEPEILLAYRTNYQLLGGKIRALTLSLNHQSNGRAEPLSRSWNRLIGSLGWERGPFVVQLGAWYRIPEAQEDDDNPDIDRFLGPGELSLYYHLGGHRLGALLRNNCRFHDNRGALQLDWVFPLGHRKIKGYLQYFTGYGESLLDYDHAVHRIGLGVILDRW